MKRIIVLERTLKLLLKRAEAFVKEERDIPGLGITDTQYQLLREWGRYVQSLGVQSSSEFLVLWADFESDYRFLPSAILVTQEDADNIIECIGTPEIAYQAGIADISDLIQGAQHAASNIQAVAKPSRL